MIELTERQREIYCFIRGKIATRGYPPTIREIGKEFKIASPNGVYTHIKALKRKGWIKNAPYMARGIELVRGIYTLPLLGRIAD